MNKVGDMFELRRDQYPFQDLQHLSVVRRPWHQLSIDELQEAVAESRLCQRGRFQCRSAC